MLNQSIAVSVCLVNYNSKDYTLRCIESIYRQTTGLNVEVILVDNGSSDGSVVAVRQAFPAVRVIANEKNLGFSAANNQGARQSAGRSILFLNNDTILKNNAIVIMDRIMRQRSKIGIIACRLLYPHGKVQRNCRAFYKNPFDTMFGRASLLSKLFPNNPITRRNTLSDWDYNSTRQVDWVSGAAMMVRREVFDQIGLLDEQFFMYWEDTDMCKRAHDAGWEVWYTPKAEIIHHSGQGGGKRSMKMRLFTMYQMHYSAYYYFRKHYYNNPLHPMAIVTFTGMVGLVAFKALGLAAGQFLRILTRRG